MNQVEEGEGDHDIGCPVDGLTQAHGPGLDVEGEQFWQQNPTDGTKTDRVGCDVGHKGNEWNNTDMFG